MACDRIASVGVCAGGARAMRRVTGSGLLYPMVALEPSRHRFMGDIQFLRDLSKAGAFLMHGEGFSLVLSTTTPSLRFSN